MHPCANIAFFIGGGEWAGWTDTTGTGKKCVRGPVGKKNRVGLPRAAHWELALIYQHISLAASAAAPIGFRHYGAVHLRICFDCAKTFLVHKPFPPVRSVILLVAVLSSGTGSGAFSDYVHRLMPSGRRILFAARRTKLAVLSSNVSYGFKPSSCCYRQPLELINLQHCIASSSGISSRNLH